MQLDGELGNSTSLGQGEWSEKDGGRTAIERSLIEDDEVKKAGKTALRPLSIPLELLALATRYLQAAHSLTPLLARRPVRTVVTTNAEDDKDSQEYADLIATYRRYVAAAIMCLRHVSQLDGGGDVRIDLRAKAMLAELLIRETTEVMEAENLLTKGASIFSLR